MQVFRRVEMQKVEGLTSGGSLLALLFCRIYGWILVYAYVVNMRLHRCGANGSHVGHLVIRVG